MLNKLNKYLNSGIILTIVFLLVGGILIVKPDISFNIISYLIGASLIVSGIYLFIIDSKTNNIFIKLFEILSFRLLTNSQNSPFIVI